MNNDESDAAAVGDVGDNNNHLGLTYCEAPL